MATILLVLVMTVPSPVRLGALYWSWREGRCRLHATGWLLLGFLLLVAALAARLEPRGWR